MLVVSISGMNEGIHAASLRSNAAQVLAWINVRSYSLWEEGKNSDTEQ